MKIKSERDFVSGILFVAAGAGFAIGATNYTVGEAARMGPGYFPLLLGALLAFLGSIVVLKSLGSTPDTAGRIGKIAWKPLLYIIGANLVFGVLLGGIPSLGVPAMGLMVATLALVVIAGMAGSRFVLKSSLVLGVLLAIGSYLTFILGLSLQFQVWPSFFAG